MPDDRARTSFNLSKQIYKEAQKYSIDADLHVNALVEKALIEYMKNHPIKK